MTKKILISFGLIIAIIACSVLFVLIYNLILGEGIKHYKQFIMPNYGQLAVYEDEETTISFDIMDEKELSEMATEENILSVNLITDDGQSLSAADWTIHRGWGCYSGETYSSKRLDIYVNFDNNVTINKIEIKYPDTTEQFDVGSIKICVLEKSSFVDTYVQIFCSTMGVNTEPHSYEKRIYTSSDIDNFSFTADYLSKNYEIVNIDLGIKGAYIDPSTLRVLPAGVEFDKAYCEIPGNEIYADREIVETVPEQNFSYLVDGSQESGEKVIFSVCKTDEFNDYLKYNASIPIFTIINTETEELFHWAPNYTCKGSFHIWDDDFAKNILEEYGV